jgi:hypothetical protein
MARKERAEPPTRERVGIRQRIVRRIEGVARDVTALFDVLVSNPRAFPSAVIGRVRDGVHGLWQSRGGGFYGLGAVGVFLFLEVRMVATEFAEAEGVAEFLVGEILEFVFRFSFMSILNGLLASIWPVVLIGEIGFWPVVILMLAGYWVFKLRRPPVEDSTDTGSP